MKDGRDDAAAAADHPAAAKVAKACCKILRGSTVAVRRYLAMVERLADAGAGARGAVTAAVSRAWEDEVAALATRVARGKVLFNSVVTEWRRVVVGSGIVADVLAPLDVDAKSLRVGLLTCYTEKHLLQGRVWEVIAAQVPRSKTARHLIEETTQLLAGAGVGAGAWRAAVNATADPPRAGGRGPDAREHNFDLYYIPEEDEAVAEAGVQDAPTEAWGGGSSNSNSAGAAKGAGGGGVRVAGHSSPDTSNSGSAPAGWAVPAGHPKQLREKEPRERRGAAGGTPTQPRTRPEGGAGAPSPPPDAAAKMPTDPPPDTDRLEDFFTRCFTGEVYTLQPDSRLTTHYRLVSVLGQGGGGVVYKVCERESGADAAAVGDAVDTSQHEKPPKYYAVKRINLEIIGDSGWLSLLREATVLHDLSRLGSPHIVAVRRHWLDRCSAVEVEFDQRHGGVVGGVYSGTQTQTQTRTFGRAPTNPGVFSSLYHSETATASTSTALAGGSVEGAFCLYLLMELCEGGSLREFIETQPRPARIARVVAQVLSGLQAVHACGVLHRDLKPSNVLLKKRDAGGGSRRKGDDEEGSGADHPSNTTAVEEELPTRDPPAEEECEDATGEESNARREPPRIAGGGEGSGGGGDDAIADADDEVVKIADFGLSTTTGLRHRIAEEVLEAQRYLDENCGITYSLLDEKRKRALENVRLLNGEEKVTQALRALHVLSIAPAPNPRTQPGPEQQQQQQHEASGYESRGTPTHASTSTPLTPTAASTATSSRCTSREGSTHKRDVPTPAGQRRRKDKRVGGRGPSPAPALTEDVHANDDDNDNDDDDGDAALYTSLGLPAPSAYGLDLDLLHGGTGFASGVEDPLLIVDDHASTASDAMHPAAAVPGRGGGDGGKRGRHAGAASPKAGGRGVGGKAKKKRAGGNRAAPTATATPTPMPHARITDDVNTESDDVSNGGAAAATGGGTTESNKPPDGAGKGRPARRRERGRGREDPIDGLTTNIGSPFYTAPEIHDPRCKAKEYTDAVDVYSVGVILYECVAGVRDASERLRLLSDFVRGVVWDAVRRRAPALVDLALNLASKDPTLRPSIDDALGVLARTVAAPAPPSPPNPASGSK